jgi:hypothetical protein
MTTKDGANVDIYDYVEADTLGDEPNEQIVHENDYIEVSSVVKDAEAVMVKGYSHISGDTVTYIIAFDTLVGLWTA